LAIHYNQGSDLLGYLVDRSVFSCQDGYVARLNRPGLGIEVDEAAVARAAEAGYRWRNPIWRLSDGSWTEW
jgi:galactonate dehydratase